MGKEEVEAAIGALETWGRTIDFWVMICAIGVAIFLSGEVVLGVAHWLNDRNLAPLRVLQSQIHANELEQLAKDTAEANQKTEAEKVERLRLEAEIAPRRISYDQHEWIVLSLKNHPMKIILSRVQGDPEAAIFAGDIQRTFEDAGITPELIPTAEPAWGLRIIPLKDWPDDDAITLSVAFELGNIPSTIAEPAPNAVALTLIVGSKPPAFPY